MRTNIDLSPFYRSSIGFDRVFDLLQNATRLPAVDNWPPYDIARTGEDAYRIVMAVAGFTLDELELTQERNVLVIAGAKAQNDEEVEYLYRGIATRSFTRRFELTDHVRVDGARLENGMLIVDLKRELPEGLKPRRIDVVAMESGIPAGPRKIEDQKRAA